MIPIGEEDYAVLKQSGSERIVTLGDRLMMGPLAVRAPRK